MWVKVAWVVLVVSVIALISGIVEMVITGELMALGRVVVICPLLFIWAYRKIKTNSLKEDEEVETKNHTLPF